MRKFYRTKIVVEVLSEDPYYETNLSNVARDIYSGECVGSVDCEDSKVLSGQEAAAALSEFGSEPAFFNLDDDGNDLD